MTLKEVLLEDIKNSKNSSWYDKPIHIWLIGLIATLLLIIASGIFILIADVENWIKVSCIIGIVLIILIFVFYIHKSIKIYYKEAIKREELRHNFHRYNVNMVAEIEEQERKIKDKEGNIQELLTIIQESTTERQKSINEIKELINEIKESTNEIKESTNEIKESTNEKNPKNNFLKKKSSWMSKNKISKK